MSLSNSAGSPRPQRKNTKSPNESQAWIASSPAPSPPSVSSQADSHSPFGRSLSPVHRKKPSAEDPPGLSTSLSLQPRPTPTPLSHETLRPSLLQQHDVVFNPERRPAALGGRRGDELIRAASPASVLITGSNSLDTADDLNDIFSQALSDHLNEFEQGVVSLLDSQLSIFEQQTLDLIKTTKQQEQLIQELLANQRQMSAELQSLSAELSRRPTLSSLFSLLVRALMSVVFFLRVAVSSPRPKKAGIS